MVYIYVLYTYIYYKHQPNVGKYASPMDPMGYVHLSFHPNKRGVVFVRMANYRKAHLNEKRNK